MTNITAAEMKQIELEQEMRTLGVIRYEAAQQKREEYDDVASTAPGMRALRTAIEPVAKAVREWCEETKKAPRRYADVVGMLDQYVPEEVAYISVRRIINGISDRQKLSTLALGISQLLLDADGALKLKRKDRKQFDVVQDWVKTYSEGKARSVMRAALRRAEIVDQKVPHEERLRLGTKIIELVQQSTGYIEMSTVKEGPNNTQTYVVASEKMDAWMDKGHAQCKLLAPMYLPMVCPPRDWMRPMEGGYYTFQLSLVRTRNKAFKEELESIEMPEVYRAVNALQGTAWRINKPIARVMAQVQEMGGGVAGIPRFDGGERPAKPIDIETNEEARKAYRKAASKHIRSLAKVKSKIKALAQKLWVAGEYGDYPAIYFPHSLDWRGRAYPIPSYVNPQSDDSGKALLEFSEGKKLGDNGAYWLAVHTANCFGFDKASFDDRVQWVLDNEDKILDSAMNGLEGERFWCEADSPFCFLAACLEWAGYRLTGEEYVSHLPIQMDGSCNGLQNFSAMLRDEVGGKATNLIPSEKPSDIYGEVAKVAAVIVMQDAANDVKEAQALLGKVNRKLTKRNCMTYVYGVSAWGMRDQLADTLEEMLAEGSIDLGECDAWNTAAYLAKVNSVAIGQVVVAAKAAMDWLQTVAKIVAKDGLPVNWTSPIGFPVQQNYREIIGTRVNLTYMGKATKVTVAREGDKLNGRRQALGIAPNFVHSCDSAHMMKTINTAADMGVTHFSFIHDSFGCHAGDMDTLAQALRVAFVEQYAGDILGDFRAQIVTQLESSGAAELAAEIPPVPPKGSLDLAAVMDSDYFFA